MTGTSTLMEYAEHRYPGCSTDVWKGEDSQLADNTVVLQVVGQLATETAINVLEQRVGEERVAAVLVRADSLPVTDRPRFDREEIASVALGAAVGAGLGVLVALIVLPGVWTSVAIAVLAGVFGAVLAAGITMRDQARHRDAEPLTKADIGFVAALIDDSATANRLAASLQQEGLYDVQVVHPE